MTDAEARAELIRRGCSPEAAARAQIGPSAAEEMEKSIQEATIERKQKIGPWSDEDIEFLRINYPDFGKMACAEKLDRSESQVRNKASELGLTMNRDSLFHRAAAEKARQAAISRKGQKRPEQAEVMKRLHAEGKLLKTDAQKAAIGARIREYFKLNGHPRGALGLKHTDEAKQRISETSKAASRKKTKAQKREIAIKALKTKAANGTFNHHRRGTWKAGWREIGGRRVYCRSRWEANYARWLQAQKEMGLIKEWEHEPETFWFEGIRRGCVSYLPDFRVTDNDGSIEYHEVKGWMDSKSKTKIRRMAKYHPEVSLVVIDAAFYRYLSGPLRASIKDWE